MGKEKGFFAGKGIGDYLVIPAALCGVAAFLLYRQNGITEFSPSLSGEAIGWLWVGVVLAVLSFFISVRPVRYAAYLTTLYAFFWFINSQVTYIANVFVSIDGNTFSSGFIATAVCFVLAFLLMLIAAITSGRKPRRKEAPKNAQA